MAGYDNLEIDLRTLKKSALVCDIVYKPLMTNLLLQAEKQGNSIVTGIGMLAHQGVMGFEKWFGEKPKVSQELINKLTK
ncbi:MAG: shikimate dehydrogenase [Lentimonas sp.]|jgi:shikimate dehydrogenase